MTPPHIPDHPHNQSGRAHNWAQQTPHGHPLAHQVPNPPNVGRSPPQTLTTFRSDQPTLSNNPQAPNPPPLHRTTTHSHPPTNVPTLSNNPKATSDQRRRHRHPHRLFTHVLLTATHTPMLPQRRRTAPNVPNHPQRTGMAPWVNLGRRHSICGPSSQQTFTFQHGANLLVKLGRRHSTGWGLPPLDLWDSVGHHPQAPVCLTCGGTVERCQRAAGGGLRPPAGMVTGYPLPAHSPTSQRPGGLFVPLGRSRVAARPQH